MSKPEVNDDEQMEEEEGQISADAPPSNDLLDEFNKLKQTYLAGENKDADQNESNSQAVKDI